MNTMPPGQTLTKRFPIVGERGSSPEMLDLDVWRLTVDGCVQTPQKFTFQDIQELPQEEWVLDVHCVTGWSKLEVHWTGVPLGTLLAAVSPLPDAQFIRFEAYSDRGHDSSLPLPFALDNVLLVHQCDGAALEPTHGFPLRSVVRDRYFYKSVKWLKRIELMAADRLGYWEGKYSYHNNADPYQEERYVSHPIPEAELRERLSSKDFRHAVAVMDDQIVQQLRGRDLSLALFDHAQIKGCKFLDCQLRSASFRNTNLTASRFVNVDLEGADFRGSDLEGAQFRNANLTGADFRECLLTATSFKRIANRGKLAGARFLAQDLAALLEGEAEFLREQGGWIVP